MDGSSRPFISFRLMVLSPLPAASLVTESFSLDLSLEAVYLVKTLRRIAAEFLLRKRKRVGRRGFLPTQNKQLRPRNTKAAVSQTFYSHQGQSPRGSCTMHIRSEQPIVNYWASRRRGRGESEGVSLLNCRRRSHRANMQSREEEGN